MSVPRGNPYERFHDPVYVDQKRAQPVVRSLINELGTCFIADNDQPIAMRNSEVLLTWPWRTTGYALLAEVDLEPKRKPGSVLRDIEAAIIYLGCRLPGTSSNLPESR